MILKTVHLNDFKTQWQHTKQAVLSAVERVGESGWLILGREVTEFEDKLARIWGLSFAVGCANGLDALEIALRCLDIQPGDKVLTTPLSAFATTLAIIRAGGIPVFVDVDDSGLIDLELCQQVLEQDSSIRFFIPVHLYGHALDLNKLAKLKQRFNLLVVEDCAQAICAKSYGQVVGTVADAAATSFYPTKNLGCMGDGGALLFKLETLAKKAKNLRDYGQSKKYLHTFLGMNSRLDELQAAILKDAFLPYLAALTHKRILIAKQYQQKIKHSNISLPVIPAGSESVWHLFPVLVNGSRESFQEHMKTKNIATAAHYPILITQQEALTSSSVPIVLSALTKAQKFADYEVSLPIHPYMNSDDIARVVAACNSWNS